MIAHWQISALVSDHVAPCERALLALKDEHSPNAEKNIALFLGVVLPAMADWLDMAALQLLFHSARDFKRENARFLFFLPLPAQQKGEQGNSIAHFATIGFMRALALDRAPQGGRANAVITPSGWRFYEDTLHWTRFFSAQDSEQITGAVFEACPFPL